MPEPAAPSALKIQVLGGWAARRDRTIVPLGKRDSLVLHTLVLSPDQIGRAEVKDILQETGMSEKQAEVALRNAARSLKDRWGVELDARHPVRLPRRQDGLSVDLWELRALHAAKKFDDALELLDDAQHLALPHEVVAAAERFAEVVREFEQIKEDLDAHSYKATARVRAMREVREVLLGQNLVAGFDPPTSIGEIRERLEPLPLPWDPHRAPKPVASPQPALIDYLSETLAEETGAPSRIVVMAPPGFGKELCAILTYIKLTNVLDTPQASSARTALFLDGRAESSQRGFASQKWLAKRLARAGDRSGRRPIVILSHADTFLATCGDRLRRALNEGIFKEADILLTCNEHFHTRILGRKGYETHEIKLTEWEPEAQSNYVSALYGPRVLATYTAWREEHRSRTVLCAVPLHLHYVVSLLAAEDGSIDAVAKRWQLFEEVAKARLRASDLDEILSRVMDDLAALAHRFYLAGQPGETAISFTEEQLRAELERRAASDLDARVQILLHRTVLDTQPQTPDRVRFHDTLWSWFFYARHLYRLLTAEHADPDQILAAFEKFLSAPVMDRCEESLADWPDREASILPRLRAALTAPDLVGVRTSRRRIAREQTGYLLGALSDDETKIELLALLDEASPSYERDDLVRRAIAIGLANRGETAVADGYVEELRKEIARGGATPRADANIDYVLSFRGDQAARIADPCEIAPDADPVRTVSELLRGLENDHHPGTWRIKLFTLLDLAERAAPQATRRRLSEHAYRLEAVLDRLESNLSRQSWPEIGEMRALLETLTAETVAD